MKRLLAVCGAMACLGGVVAAADVLAQVGVTAVRAKDAVGGVLNYGISTTGLRSTAFKSMPPAARAEAATAGVAWIKAYVATPEFKKSYAAIREGMKPQPPVYAKTPEQEAEVSGNEANPDDMKKLLESLPPDQRKAFEETMKQVQAQVAALNTPEARAQRVTMIKAGRVSDQTAYEGRVATWAQDYPESPNPLIIKRLKEFLADTADVDFAAKISGQGSSAVFANSTYEGKPTNWKVAFRAGKEATAAARTAVQAWLKELGA